MLLSALLLALAPNASTAAPPAPAPVAVQDRRAEVRDAYHELAAAGDEAGLRALWGANPALVLQTIDADLEGSLAKWEAAPDAPPTDEIAALHARALFGARCATLELGRPIFVDYASSFVGWNDEEKLDFRTGQKVYGRAMEELEAGNLDVALEAAKETVLRAAPLGDWWGTAMGYGAQGQVLQMQGELADALTAWSHARLLNADLGLQYAEYRSLLGMLGCLRGLERWQRGLAVADAAIAYAKGYGDPAGLRDALSGKHACLEGLGRTEEAAAAKAELEKLGE
ncbi:MAG: hypothetical protein H6828_00590 [Planctomycetes bacterium]|nr:hypothetical protein [Planctomycetota bacterium]